MERRSSPTTSCDLYLSIAHVFSDLFCPPFCSYPFSSVLLFVSMSYHIVYRGYNRVSCASTTRGAAGHGRNGIQLLNCSHNERATPISNGKDGKTSRLSAQSSQVAFRKADTSYQ